MFKILQEKNVRMMTWLASENRGLAKDCLDGFDLKALFELCREHELCGVVASHIIADGIEGLPDYWLEEYRRENERLTFLKEKTLKICAVMREAGIPMVILKNGGIMTDIVADAAACPMEDIDSFVRKNDFLRAHQILIDNGFVFRFRSEYEREELESAFADGSTEYYIDMPDGGQMWFELSWRAVAGRWIRPDKEPTCDELFERFYYSNGTDVGILSPEDNLLQVCVHTAKHSYVRSPGLRLHLDVDRIVSNKQIDWQVFLDRVEKAHLKTAVYYSLLIPKNLFSTPVPDEVLNRLKPKRAKARRIEKLLKKSGLMHPVGRKFSKLEFLRFQTSLYDSVGDMIRVIYPSYSWYKQRYGIKCALALPYYIALRALDLVGIRKKK